MRRWAKAASTTANTSRRSAVVFSGSVRRTSETSPLSTLGAGQKTLRPMEPARLTSAYQLAFTDGTPYTFDPGGAASRSATSACTMTRVRSMLGNVSSMCSSTGTATLYGRFATRAVGGGPGSSVTRMASECTSENRSARAGHPGGDGGGQRAREHVVDLDGDDPVGGLQQREGEGPEPRPDLDDHVVGPHTGGAHDTADGVGVDHEVLPALLGGPDAEDVGQLTDVGGTEQGIGGGVGDGAGTHGSRVRGVGGGVVQAA